MLRFIPDWFVYGTLLLLLLINAQEFSKNAEAPRSSPPDDLGPLLPQETPNDPQVTINIGAPQSGIGTAFSIDNTGQWITARHVVDSCDRVGLSIGDGKAISATMNVSQDYDLAVLTTGWVRPALPTDLLGQRQIGEPGFFFGFPQGEPGEVTGLLLGRRQMVVKGRYETRENIIAWSETGRTRGLKGGLGGLSGGPALDSDGEVIGIVAAHSPRRGRIYTLDAKSLREYVPDSVSAQAEPIDKFSYGRMADRMRRARRVAQVVCLVKS